MSSAGCMRVSSKVSAFKDESGGLLAKKEEFPDAAWDWRVGGGGCENRW